MDTTCDGAVSFCRPDLGVCMCHVGRGEYVEPDED